MCKITSRQIVFQLFASCHNKQAGGPAATVQYSYGSGSRRVAGLLLLTSTMTRACLCTVLYEAAARYSIPSYAGSRAAGRKIIVRKNGSRNS